MRYIGTVKYLHYRDLLLLRSNTTLSLLADERLVDVGDDSTASDGGLDQSVQLLVSPDGELEMSGGDSLHLQVLTGVAGQLEDLSSEVFQDGGAVDSSGGSDSAAAEGPGLEVTVDPSHRELESSSGAPRNRLLLGLPGIFTSFSSSHVEWLVNLRFRSLVEVNQ